MVRKEAIQKAESRFYMALSISTNDCTAHVKSLWECGVERQCWLVCRMRFGLQVAFLYQQSQGVANRLMHRLQITQVKRNTFHPFLKVHISTVYLNVLL